MTWRYCNNVCMGERRREEELGPEEENGKRWTEPWERSEWHWIHQRERGNLGGRGPGWAKRGMVSLQSRAEPLQHRTAKFARYLKKVPHRGPRVHGRLSPHWGARALQGASALLLHCKEIVSISPPWLRDG